MERISDDELVVNSIAAAAATVAAAGETAEPVLATVGNGLAPIRARRRQINKTDRRPAVSTQQYPGLGQ